MIQYFSILGEFTFMERLCTEYASGVGVELTWFPMNIVYEQAFYPRIVFITGSIAPTKYFDSI